MRNSWSETTLFGAGSQKRDLRGSSVKRFEVDVYDLNATKLLVSVCGLVG